MAASPLVDSHVHLWDLSRRDYPWLAGQPGLNETHGWEAFDRACGAVPVGKAVFVECTVAFDDEAARDEVRWVEMLAGQDARLQGIVAHASLERGEAIGPHLEWLAGRPLVKGVRRLLQDEPDPVFCLQPAFVEGVRRLADFDLTFDLCVYVHQLPHVVRLVEQCPQVAFVLDHMGKPAIRDGATEPWQEHLCALADRPNVTCKISGALTEAGPDGWRPEQVRPYLEYAIEQFGFDRVMFGGDWPMLKPAGTYPEWVALVRRAVHGASEAEQRKLFQDTAERVYRLDGC